MGLAGSWGELYGTWKCSWTMESKTMVFFFYLLTQTFLTQLITNRIKLLRNLDEVDILIIKAHRSCQVIWLPHRRAVIRCEPYSVTLTVDFSWNRAGYCRHQHSFVEWFERHRKRTSTHFAKLNEWTFLRRFGRLRILSNSQTGFWHLITLGLIDLWVFGLAGMRDW